MDIAKEIKKILIEEDMNLSDLAKKLDMSVQSLSAKLLRNKMKIEDIEEIAEMLGYELKIEFVKKGE
jgi:transcriptional regulator with XRE-family HTH domain